MKTFYKGSRIAKYSHENPCIVQHLVLNITIFLDTCFFYHQHFCKQNQGLTNCCTCLRIKKQAVQYKQPRNMTEYSCLKTQYWDLVLTVIHRIYLVAVRKYTQGCTGKTKVRKCSCFYLRLDFFVYIYKLVGRNRFLRKLGFLHARIGLKWFCQFFKHIFTLSM